LGISLKLSGVAYPVVGTPPRSGGADKIVSVLLPKELLLRSGERLTTAGQDPWQADPLPGGTRADGGKMLYIGLLQPGRMKVKGFGRETTAEKLN